MTGDVGEERRDPDSGHTNSYRYICNRERREIHRVIASSAGRHSLEACNLDDMLDDEELEEADALRIVAAAPERRCGHCWPEGRDGHAL